MNIPPCPNCKTPMSSIIKENKYNFVVQIFGMMIILPVVIWIFTTLAIGFSFEFLFLALIPGYIAVRLLTEITKKKQLRACPSCGYNFEIKK